MMRTKFNTTKKNRNYSNVNYDGHTHNNDVQEYAIYYTFIKRTPM